MTIPSDLLRKIRHIEIRARKAVNNVFSGEYHSIFKGRGMEFAEVRPYQPGDDIRSMDWKVTARTGQPFIKVFHEERELTLMLLVDLSGSESFGSVKNFKSETAAELCAALAFSAIRNKDKVGLIAFTDKVELYIAPKKGRAHVLRLIREVLYFQPERKGTDIAAALDYLSNALNKKAILFLVSDFKDEDFEKPLRATARAHDLIAVKIRDPREEALPDVGLITLNDPETGDTVAVDTSSKALRQEYASSVAQDTAELSKLFRGAGIDEIDIRTDQSYIEPLIRFFKQREKRLKAG